MTPFSCLDGSLHQIMITQEYHFHIPQETTKYMPYWIPVTWLNWQGILWEILGALRIMNRVLLTGAPSERLLNVSLGNSLNINHIVWQRHKMKVNLAVQTLNSSVANALEFLKDDLKLPEFKDCGPAILFIRKIDRVFDILNSRNPYGKSFKSPLRY